MDLSLQDVTELLHVTELEVKDWVKTGKIPFYRLNNELRFSRCEIEDWMLHSGVAGVVENASFNRKNVVGSQAFNLFRAVNRGGVFFDVEACDKEQLIRQMAEVLSERFSWDKEAVSQLLLDRERLMPTALNQGVAVPHTRDFLLNTHFDLVTLVFLKKPLEYGALDQRPVDTLFFLFACEDKKHLQLLAKIAHLSSQTHVLDKLRHLKSTEEVLDHIRVWEANLAGMMP